LKQYKQSAASYEKAIRHGSKDPQVHYNLGFTYEKLGNRRKAMEEYEKFSASSPTMDVLTTLADYYLKQKDYNSAIRSYEKMLKITVKKGAVYSSLGYVYGLKGNIDKEIENYKIALKYDKEDDAIYYNLGEAYEKKGMYKEALKEYTSAYEINPDSGKAARKIPQMKIKILQKKYNE